MDNCYVLEVCVETREISISSAAEHMAQAMKFVAGKIATPKLAVGYFEDLEECRYASSSILFMMENQGRELLC